MAGFRKLMLAVTALLAASVANLAMAQAAPEIVGEWHGTVAAPTGDAMMILYVTRGEGGTLKAELESRDIAPGRKVPVDEIASASGRLSFKVNVIRAIYEGTWDERSKQWLGKLTQSAPRVFNLSSGLPPPKPRVEGLDGLWEATVESNGAKLRQVLRIATGDWGTNALFDSPDQQATNILLTDLAREGDAVRFSAARGAAKFAGTLSWDGDQLMGTWKSSGQPETRTTFTRTQLAAERAPPARPQNPREPFPYKAEEVAFDNPAAPAVHISGTLTMPQGSGPFPVAIMITGSGGHDRDETLDGHKPFLVIADHLARNGVAVLRFDDRGVGKSSGNSHTATSADKASDVNAAFAYLSGRPEIRHDAIGFIGHSEGGLIGAIAMAGNARVAFLISLAGPADDMLHLMLSQFRLRGARIGVSPEQMDRAEPVIVAIFKAVAAAKTPDAAREAALAVLTPNARAVLGIRPDANAADALESLGDLAGPRFHYLTRYDPRPNLARIKVPVLALNGALDVQVPAKSNLAALRKALKSNRDATIIELPGLNHMFQTAKTGAVGEYRDIEETFAPAVLTLMSDWIHKRFVER